MTERSTARRRGRWLVPIAAGLAVAAVVALTKGPPSAVPTPPGTFAFAALGDAPYYVWEAWQYRQVLDDINAHDLGFVVHVGDIFWRPCSEARYRRTLAEFAVLAHPVVYTPGDNEWTDCWTRQEGGYAPLDRLAILRELFFSRPTQSLGGRSMALESQAGTAEFPEFVEHARWEDQGIVFATLHLPGSRNAREEFLTRTAADDEASIRRTEAAVTWLGDTVARAEAGSARAIVLAFHANPAFEEPPDDPYRRSYEPFIETLEEEAFRFGRPVLLVHGDDHEFVVDQPLVRRATGLRLDNVTRLQVPGSPEVGWVRVVVRPVEPVQFSFSSRVVPRWKYW